jgi:anti-sigma28 factor (negative regulator of flagellin synthesis)
MRPQVFPVTRTFNQQPWCSYRVATNRHKTRSGAQHEKHTSTTFRDPRPSDRLSTLTPQTRTDKIAQLQRAMESGTYCVSAEQIAEKMLRETLVEEFA